MRGEKREKRSPGRDSNSMNGGTPGTCWDNNEEAEKPCVVLLTLMKLKRDTHKHLSVTISVRTPHERIRD